MIYFGYLPKDSIIHRLNPLVKFFWLCVVGLLSFVLSQPHQLGVLLVLIVLAAFASKVFGPWLRFMRIALLPALVILIVNILMAPYHGERMMFASYAGSNELLFHYDLGIASFTVTTYSLQKGLFLGLRWLNLVAPAGVFIYTTRPEDFSASLYSLRVPYTISFSIAMAFRLLPLLIQDMQMVLNAQRSRGLDWDRGILRRFRAAPVIAFPIIACSIRRALDMAAAMEARAYGAAHTRTLSHPLIFTAKDGLWFTAAVALFVLGLVNRLMM